MSTQDLKLFDLLDGLEMTKSQYEWLARRFENMTAKEALLFRGAMQIEQPQATCDVMQIANQLEHYELLYGAGNDFLPWVTSSWSISSTLPPRLGNFLTRQR